MARIQAAIAGGVAEAFFGGVPRRIEAEVRYDLNETLLKVAGDIARLNQA